MSRGESPPTPPQPSTPSDRPRLIEVAFPLKQTSIDSVHEKNVRHGHISTLHIWPARRPLAACRAALIATLLPDPGTPEARRALCERIGGKIVKVSKKKTVGGRTEVREVEETVGGILHWGRETENKADLDWFRAEIRKAYGGRAPRVLDPFAGGGAIPLEAMRLGCEAAAIDINPVAWFILRCTLEYPQKLAGQKRRLPDFALHDREFMTEFFKASGFKKAQIGTFLKEMGLASDDSTPPLTGLAGQNVDPSFLDADLGWHVRAWGRWVLARARKELAESYPVYADFHPLVDVEEWREKNPKLVKPLRRVPTDAQGVASVDAWNSDVFAEASKTKSRKRGAEQHPGPTTPAAYLADKTLPRWVMKPTVAYLWARTVPCKNCRATVPLLKTRWLAKKDNKRVLLLMQPNAERTGVVFDVQTDSPRAGGNNAIRREHDRKMGQGTMSRAGATCPCCGKPGTVAMEMEDLRRCGTAEKPTLGAVMVAAVVDGPHGKEYRLPTDDEQASASVSEARIARAFRDVPFGVPGESMPGKEALGIRVPLYGFTVWSQMFTPRQLATLATFVCLTRSAGAQPGLSPDVGAQIARPYLALMLDRLANQSAAFARWNVGGENIEGVFARFALPIMWDFAEVNPLSDTSGAYASAVDWVALASSHVSSATRGAPAPSIENRSAIEAPSPGAYDVIVTDPPYYDAIPYSDLMDFFYVWLRRTIGDERSMRHAFASPLAPKWDDVKKDGELIDDSSRHGNDAKKSKQAYEDGMARAFVSCATALKPDGRLVIVFANKQPDAWETLVSAIVRAGFAVDGSWPIQTERMARVRSLSSAALASSVWLVCKKRPIAARSGWDRDVLKEMESNIHGQLRSFWDAGIRGPDFVWAATGPAMEAYSKHPIVKKADKPSELMSVSEFLRAVRRIVVDFVVGRVLSRGEDTEASAETQSLDDVTTYYLLHRHDFKMDDAPAGACILYAVSCNLSENELADRYDVLVRTGGSESSGDDEDDDEDDAADAEAEDTTEGGSGSTFKLKAWKQRTRPGLGVDPGAESVKRRHEREAALGPRLPGLDDTAKADVPFVPKSVPLIDVAHHLMHLWASGDEAKVNAYIDDRGLRRNVLFHKLLQALIELSHEGSDERRVLEVVMNHFRELGVTMPQTMAMKFLKDEGETAAAETGAGGEEGD